MGGGMVRAKVRYLFFLGVYTLLLGSGCCALTGEPASNARSVAVIKRVKPRLEETLGDKGHRWGVPVLIRIFKSENELELWVLRNERYSLFKTYKICYYSGKIGPKLVEGDLQAPEGFYGVTPDLMNPWSRFHLSFNIGYPNAYDRAHGRTGSYIMVHGSCVSTGCFAMADAMIEEIWALVDAALRDGQEEVPVHVFPFRPTETRLESAGDAKWIDFWHNLEQGYAYFERYRRPPKVSVARGRYVFE